jgi:hypothetical protein
MRQKGKNIVAKLKGALEIAQASLAIAQQRQEEAANRRRSEALVYRPGDKVTQISRRSAHMPTD